MPTLPPDSRHSQPAAGPTKLRYLLTLMTWAFLGPVGMFIMLAKIAERGDGWWTGHDVTFFVLLAAALACRWIDARAGDPITAGPNAPSPAAAWRYTLLVAPLAIVLWIAANLLANR